MFLETLRKYDLLCEHPDSSFRARAEADGERVLRCVSCGSRLSVTRLLCGQLSSSLSVSLADMYARWTGDDDVPCLLVPVLRCRVLPVRIETPLSTLVRGVALLRAAHAPFEAGPDGVSDRVLPAQNESSARDLFRTLAVHHRSLAERVSGAKDDLAGRSSVGEIAAAVLAFAGKSAFPDGADPFDRYFRVLAPRAKRAAETAGVRNARPFARKEFRESAGPPVRSLDEDLAEELSRCASVFRVYSRHDASFDAVHVAVLCFLFRDSLSAVCNLAFDFAANFLSGYYEGSFFFSPASEVSDVGRRVWKFLDGRVSPSENPRFYYHLLKYRRGGDELAGWFSEEFFETHEKLKRVAKTAASSRLSEGREGAEEEEEDSDGLFERTFPRMLFEGKDFSDFYAFRASRALYASEKKTNAKEGAVARCKSLYSFVRKCFSKVNAFRESFATGVFQKNPASSEFAYDSGGDFRDRDEYEVNWTIEMVERFLELDLEFEKELVEAILEHLSDPGSRNVFFHASDRPRSEAESDRRNRARENAPQPVVFPPSPETLPLPPFEPTAAVPEKPRKKLRLEGADDRFAAILQESKTRPCSVPKGWEKRREEAGHLTDVVPETMDLYDIPNEKQPSSDDETQSDLLLSPYALSKDEEERFLKNEIPTNVADDSQFSAFLSGKI